ncbi:hypothetical protein A3K34_04455 [candidate division WWE3 bacterium RIFOXYC1_FULL_40_10]|nr:MAG: hypothetical protein A3K58_04455 [candidate division WWE3 bacterium RIFOXYB1_FULL_40_22]OGC62094.1 MAG: hypothetical protein A3K37_04455 [candidate division WWE3 bacterium RIFOXYA1_FULL_40_11]OGC66477.1 MAG: hypothetical protein A3K34_04455 [candidate division WWE3 bacterium RIFOXYC1_FULL_40_10]OGC67205.1 MAG: hypothetical protein A2450_00005 [candidate division WWE3 bacterium RIFOXYC2_FULL_40_11]OGC70792.1 MAG: hypothetical protein A2602_03105 [candidate division WWE3 bacterium RIFOXYD
MFLFGAITPTYVLADDECKKIEDLDKRAECYEAKIDKKESEYNSTTKQLDEIRTQKDSINQKIQALSSELNVTQGQIDEIDSEVDAVQAELEIINGKILDRQQKLGDKINLRNRIIRSYFIKRVESEITLFLMNNGFENASFNYAFSKAANNETKKLIEGLNFEISNFEADKAESLELKNDLENSLASLAKLRADLATKKNQQQEEFKETVADETKTINKLSNLQNEIDELSAKQQDILKQKYGDEYGSVGDFESPTASTPSPPFKPAFAAFSYGAYTHYKGMSQYGAKGRADKGDDYKEILKFYYKVDAKEKDDFPSKLCVEGYGDLSFSKYLYGIAEMPSDWPDEALKAQAIAARSYAYRYYKAGKCICTTQSCQVYSKSKSDNPPSKWKSAVDDTEGIILDNDIVAYYSSTTGGYIDNVGWDTECGSSSCWPSKAYEKSSPWFYKAWYTKSYNNSDSCGRGHPWLSEKEMADILNAYVVWNKGNNSDRDHISPVTTNCWGGDPYSLDEMADKAGDYGTKYTKVTSIDVEVSNGGYTSNVTLRTDNGTVSVNGETFKTVFNLRAPGYLSIKSKLFDMEKRE